MIGAVDCATIAADVREAGGAGDAEATLAVEPAAYRAHDRAMYGGAGHAQAWDVMLRTFVDAAWGSELDGTEERAGGRGRRAVAPPAGAQPVAADPARRPRPVGDLNAAGVPLGIVSNSEGTDAASCLPSSALAARSR